MEWNKFIRLFLQKILRNLASAKIEMLILLYIPVVKGMFTGQWIKGEWVAIIPAGIGLTFLGGGFVTLALGRMYINQKLNGNSNINNDSTDIDSEDYNKSNVLKTD